MTSEVIIDVQQKEISIALLEDKRLVEYQNEPRSASFSVGNIYVAKVKKLMPGLNACFVDVGYERDAFLHYLDLGSQFNSYAKYLKQVSSDRKKLYPISKATRLPDLKKDGSVQTTLTVGQEVLVQIVKEPISTKGPRLTGELSFAGRYLVLMPFNDKVSVSSKIKSGEERARLKQLIQSIKPKNFGIISTRNCACSSNGGRTPSPRYRRHSSARSWCSKRPAGPLPCCATSLIPLTRTSTSTMRKFART